MHTELSRTLWNDLDRLEEDLHHWDRGRTGFLPRDTLYTTLRAARIPVDVELLNSMLDQYVYKWRSCCKIQTSPDFKSCGKLDKTELDTTCLMVSQLRNADFVVSWY